MADLSFSQFGQTQKDMSFSQFNSQGAIHGSQAREMAGWERTLDLLSRTTYVSAGFVDRILDEDTKTIAEAWNFARSEFFTPEERLTYSDVLKNHAPVWSKAHPVMNFMAGLGMDIALDPLTYVGPGLIKGAGQLTGGILRGGTKAAKALNAVRKGTAFDDIGEATARGMAAGLADDTAMSAGQNFHRAGIEFIETSRAAKTLEQGRKATATSVGKQYSKRLTNVQKRHSQELVTHQKNTAQAIKKAEMEALQDIEQYGIADARRVREIRLANPTLPERAVQQAGVLGRDSRLAAPQVARKGSRTVKVAETKQIADTRRAFPNVPEQSINPKFGKGQGPGVMTAADDITRVGKPLIPEQGTQMALRAKEAHPATRVTKLGKPVIDPLRGAKGVARSEDVIKYIDEVTAPIKARQATDLAKTTIRQQEQLRGLKTWHKNALNDGINIQDLATQLGRQRSTTARMQAKWMPATDKRVADAVSSVSIREALEHGAGGVKGVAKGIKGEWKGLNKSLGIVSGAKNINKWLGNSDTFFGRKYDFMKELLVRDYKLPDWLVKHRSLLYGKMLRAVPRVQDELSDIFGTISKADSEKVGQRFYEIFWETEKVKKAQGGLKAGQAADIRMSHLADLTDQERVMAAKVYERFSEVGRLDFEAGLVDELIENYVPGLYQNLEKNFFGMSKKVRKQIPNEFTPGEQKLFHSLDEITAAGLKPVRDLQTLYTARVLAHEQGLAQALFNSQLEKMYPGMKMVREARPDDFLKYKTSVNTKNLKKSFPGAKLVTEGQHKGAWMAKDGTLLTPSTRVGSEISYIGTGLYGPEGFAGANRMLQTYDKGLGFFRSAATVLKPAFAFKQILSNTAQVYLEFGAKGLKMFDPRVMVDTAMIMSRNDGAFALRNVFGETLHGKQLTAEAFQHGMLTNTPIDVGMAKNWNPRNVREMQRLVNRERNIRSVAGITAKGEAGKEVAEGFTRSFLGAMKYTDLPGHVEDWFRVSTFINARRMGFSAEQAAKHTQNALFDYLHGLSEFEAKWARRVVPFYSYQRFAIPLMGKVLATNPGRIANLGKTTDAFFKTWNKVTSGETLNESERRVLPNWLIDQPNAFEEFDERMRATFGTFNSFTPLDIITNFQEVFGAEGKETFDLDEGLGRALEKGVMSQITPMIKWPLEAMINRKFFQGSAVSSGGGKSGSTRGVKRAQGDYDADVFFANMAGATSAFLGRNKSTTAYALIGKFMGKEIAENSSDDLIEDFLTIVTGWEEGIDPESGERTVYMSPWKIHMATSFFPFLKEVFRQSDPDLTATQKTLSLYTGRQTVKIDLDEQKQRKTKEAQGIISRKEREAQHLLMTQQNDAYHKARFELTEMYNELGDHLSLLNSHGVTKAIPKKWVQPNIGDPFSKENKSGMSFSQFNDGGG